MPSNSPLNTTHFPLSSMPVASFYYPGLLSILHNFHSRFPLHFCSYLSSTMSPFNLYSAHCRLLILSLLSFLLSVYYLIAHIYSDITRRFIYQSTFYSFHFLFFPLTVYICIPVFIVLHHISSPFSHYG